MANTSTFNWLTMVTESDPHHYDSDIAYEFTGSTGGFRLFYKKDRNGEGLYQDYNEILWEDGGDGITWEDGGDAIDWEGQNG